MPWTPFMSFLIAVIPEISYILYFLLLFLDLDSFLISFYLELDYKWTLKQSFS